MFALKDIESLKNLASILTIPFFAAAYLIDGVLETILDPFLDWLRNFPQPLVQIGGWGFLAAYGSCRRGYNFSAHRPSYCLVTCPNWG